MADIKINEKLVVSQTGTAEPILASNVTGGGGLTALGTVTTGNIDAIAPAGGGKILQVVTSVNTGKTMVSGGSGYTGYALNVSSDPITPASTSNKIIVHFTTILGATGTNGNKKLKVYRNGVTDLVLSGNAVHSYMSGDVPQYGVDAMAWTYTDSPSTTSATYYSIMTYDDGNDQIIVGGRSDNDANCGVFWTLMEIE